MSDDGEGNVATLQERFRFMRDVPCGVEIPSGWVLLVWDLCTVLEDLGIDCGQVQQVKEKFGGLRFYVDDMTDAQRVAVGWAESLSFSVCEVCGERGNTRERNRCLSTLCDHHAATEGYALCSD